MSSRAKKIVALALQNKTTIISSNNEDAINADSSPFAEILSPQDISELINEAEVVFENDSSCFAYTMEDIDAPLHNISNNIVINTETEIMAVTSNINEMENIEAEVTEQIPSVNFVTADDISELYIGTSNSEEIVQRMDVCDNDNVKNANSAHKTQLNDIENMDDMLLEKSTDNESDSNYSDEEDLQVSSTDEDEESDNNENDLEILNGEHSSHNKKKRVKGQNKRDTNKRLRMSGEKYLGFRKPSGQRNTFHDTERKRRKLKERCNCKKDGKDPAKKCYLINNVIREQLFTSFWKDMTWDQRRIFVCNTVKVITTKRPRKLDHSSRRSATLQYNLIVGNEKIPVCKKMYLGTLSLGEWSARTWAMKGQNGMSESFVTSVSKREKRRDIFQEEKEFLVKFLSQLNKLPSHYCRKDSERLYLEQMFQSYNDLYRAYTRECEENDKKPLSLSHLTKVANDMKISLFRPRKDQCDTCIQYKNKNLSEEYYQRHISRKEAARNEKNQDKNEAILGRCHVITMDVQSVKLCPQLAASALYYKTKLCCHNFTVYNVANSQVTCYWYEETNADGQASTYASFLVDYLECHFLHLPEILPIIIYSDGCTAQNRNSILSNALLHLSEKYNVCITQKFLEKGHTQMECDSVHSAIETALKNKEIYLPSDYLRITREARRKNPYVVKNMDYKFFRNFGEKNATKYNSIRPSKTSGGASVTDIRVLQYTKGRIWYKINFDDDFEELPVRPKTINLATVVFPPLFKSQLPISKTKFEHLQAIKTVLPKDCWSFYDSLPKKDT